MEMLLARTLKEVLVVFAIRGILEVQYLETAQVFCLLQSLVLSICPMKHLSCLKLGIYSLVVIKKCGYLCVHWLHLWGVCMCASMCNDLIFLSPFLSSESLTSPGTHHKVLT